MTVVVAIDYFDEILVIADTRISRNGIPDNENGIEKLIPISDGKTMGVMGFSGSVNAAKQVFQKVQENLTNYNKHFKLSQFNNDLRRWIEEETRTIGSDELKHGLSFILAGFNPYRRRPLTSPDGSKTLMPFYEKRFYRYEVLKTGKVKLFDEDNIIVIGSGKDLKDQILANVNQFIDFGRTMPNFHEARSLVLSDVISRLFGEIDSKMVGGPFQIWQIIPPNTYQWAYLPPYEQENHTDVSIQGNKTVFRNTLTANIFKLIPLSEWA